MRKSIAITVLTLLLVAMLGVALPALAVNELTFNADTTIALTNPSTNITILNNSKVDSMTVNAGSVDFTISTNGLLIFRSTDRKSLSHNSTTLSVDSTCNGYYSQLLVDPGPGVSASTFTITVSSATCSGGSTTSTASSGGGGGGGGGDSSTATETTTTETTTTTTETTTAPTAETAPVSQKISTIAGQPATDAKGKVTLEQMTADAEIVISGDANKVAKEMGVSRDTAAEANYNETIVAKVIAGATAAIRNVIVSFVTYGTKGTKVLGAGERAGVVNSFKAAFGKLPADISDWNDVVKIANGRWPTQRSADSESGATESFKKIYLRDPDRTNPNDDAAVTVMSYGLRPADRNLNSEKAGIRIFRDIYGYNPSSATDWDAVRAIAYSGATR